MIRRHGNRNQTSIQGHRLEQSSLVDNEVASPMEEVLPLKGRRKKRGNRDAFFYLIILIIGKCHNLDLLNRFLRYYQI